MENQFKLIEGVFTPSDAKKVLYSLIQNKINYHNVEILATQERSDGDVSHSEARVVSLMAMKGKLKELLDLATELNLEVSVGGSVEVTLLKS